jgi:hypothetical protein
MLTSITRFWKAVDGYEFRVESLSAAYASSSMKLSRQNTL